MLEQVVVLPSTARFEGSMVVDWMVDLRSAKFSDRLSSFFKSSSEINFVFTITISIILLAAYAILLNT